MGYYYLFVLVVLQWLAFGLGIFLRRLAGLEAMFVLQFSWLVMLWLDSTFILPYEMVYALKFSSGYNHPFFSQTELESKQNPYFSQFSMSRDCFADNFNFTLALPLLSFVVAMVSYLRLKCFLSYRK